MSSGARKPPPAPSSANRLPIDPNSPNRTPSISPTPPAGTNGVARTRSIRAGAPVSARAAMNRSGTASSSLGRSDASATDEDARAETVALLEELKDRLRITELKSEQFQRHAELLQSRLDDAIKEQGKLEDQLHESDERLEILENDKRDTARQLREMESIYEAERMSMNREKEDMANKEEEMQTVIQRLKDTLSQKMNIDDEPRLSRQSNNSSPGLDSHYAPSSAVNRTDSRNNSKILLQKDRLIESLRLELAETQIKLVESENMGGGRLQEVERLLLETRMNNARLMEDNESFQLLLSEKTLNGDFIKNDFAYMGASSNADALSALEGRTVTSSLADELSEAGENESDNYRRLEAELKSQKDQNKALTLYINKIIERLLQHQDFEAILDQSSDFKPGAAGNTNKELPPPPPPKEAGVSILQRAKSVALGGAKRPRPMSQMPAAQSALTDPDTAPSIPFGLGRSNSTRTGPAGRPKSEQFSGGVANVVNRMYSGGPISPTLAGPPARSSPFFSAAGAGSNSNIGVRHASGGQTTSGSFPGGKTSENSSTSGDDVVTPGNSPPRPEKSATFAGNKPRPLRLVQENPDTARKVSDTIAEDNRAKRGSWMGWAMSAVGKKEDPPPESIQE